MHASLPRCSASRPRRVGWGIELLHRCWFRLEVVGNMSAACDQGGREMMLCLLYTSDAADDTPC
eukprot:7321964-Pyramimonas_sp.AAC.2